MIDWIERRVLPVSGEAAALFRIVFGTLLLAYFLTHAVEAEWVAQAVPESPLHRLALPTLQAAPQIADWIAPWISVWTVLFIAGAFTRFSFAMMTAGAIVWSLVYTMRVGAHAVGVLLVAMVCLLAAPWTRAWSLDEWRKGRRADRTPSRAYGYAIWILGFVLATSLAAAAFAKIRLGGIGWITNGTVKYHFLTDSPDALVDWGLRLAPHDGLAVLLSLAAVAVEGLVIVGACATRYVYRLAAGLATLGLFVGFALFQGLFWPAWWLLLLAFLPWHLAGTSRESGIADPDASGLGPHIVVIGAVVLVQAVASLARLEVAPFVSAFDMYSSTYSSPADYEAKAGMSYFIAADFADGKSGSCRISREDADAVAAGTTPRLARLLESCFDAGAPAVRAVSIEGMRRQVDWARWRLGDEVRQPLAGPFPINRASPEP